ncbi:MAG: hypothetical protein ACRC6I_02555 [Paracoccaceae bacterium]
MPKITKTPAPAGLSGLRNGLLPNTPKLPKGPKGKGPGQMAGVKKIPLPGKNRGR